MTAGLGRFDASHRVRKRSEFRTFQATRWKVVSPGFVFLLGCDPGGSKPRLGVTASRRIGGAVVRNRAKRLVRAAFCTERTFWPRQLVVVVIVRTSLAGLKLQDVCAEWRSVRGRMLKLWPRVAASLGDSRERPRKSNL